MRDGQTRELSSQSRDESFEAFRASWRATVVVLSGDAAGSEFAVETPRVTIGRGEEADWAFPDDTLSKLHAALEFGAGELRLRDLGSRNGSRVNGEPVEVAPLKHGDRFRLGCHEFQLVLEEHREPRTYVLPED